MLCLLLVPDFRKEIAKVSFVCISKFSNDVTLPHIGAIKCNRYNARTLLTDKKHDSRIIVQLRRIPLRQYVDRPRLPGEILQASILRHQPPNLLAF